MELVSSVTRFFSHKKTQPIVLFDIGSLSIGGAVVSFSGDTPHIEYSIRKPVPFNTTADEEHLLLPMAEVLVQVAKDIQQNGLGAKESQLLPDEVVCILATPWHSTRTMTASFEHKENFKVTDIIMDNLLAQIRDKKDSESVTGKKTISFEEVVIDSTLNGYTTESPIGKMTRSIAVTFLESSMSLELNSKIKNSVYEVFSPEIPVVFRSFTLASFSTARDIFEDVQEFIVLDVTGEVSGMSVVRNAVIRDTLSFPYGRNTLIRDISKEMESVPEETLSRIKIFLSSNDGELREHMLTEEEKFVKMFAHACEQLSSEILPLPQTIFLVIDPVFEGWFRKNLEHVDFGQFTTTREPFHVRLLTGKRIEDMCEIEKGVLCDNFLNIEALFYAREHGTH